GLAFGCIDQLLTGSTFGTYSATRNRRIRVAFDLDNLFVFHIDFLAATYCTVGAHALDRSISGGITRDSFHGALRHDRFTSARLIRRYHLADDWPSERTDTSHNKLPSNDIDRGLLRNGCVLKKP